MDSEHLERFLARRSLKDVDSHESLTDEKIHKYLNNTAIEYRETVVVDRLESSVKRELRMDMFNRSAKPLMETLLVSYLS